MYIGEYAYECNLAQQTHGCHDGCIVALRKVSIAAVTVLVSEFGVGMQIHVALFVLMVSLTVHLVAHPFMVRKLFFFCGVVDESFQWFHICFLFLYCIHMFSFLYCALLVVHTYIMLLFFLTDLIFLLTRNVIHWILLKASMELA